MINVCEWSEPKFYLTPLLPFRSGEVSPPNFYFLGGFCPLQILRLSFSGSEIFIGDGVKRSSMQTLRPMQTWREGGGQKVQPVPFCREGRGWGCRMSILCGVGEEGGVSHQLDFFGGSFTFSNFIARKPCNDNVHLNFSKAVKFNKKIQPL